MDMLSKITDGYTLSQILEALGNPPKSSVYTILQQMVKMQYLTYIEKEKKYKIGSGLVRLSSMIMSNHTIQNLARPVMEELAQLTGEDIYLGILESGKLLYIDKIEGTESVRVNFRIGTAIFAHVSSIGKLLLANLKPEDLEAVIKKNGLPALSSQTITDYNTLLEELKSIRENGISYSNEEAMDGLYSVGVPIKNVDNEIVAGICISAPISRFLPKKELFTRLIQEAAQKISKSLQK